MKWQPLHKKALVCVHWSDADASAPTEAFYEEEIKHRTTPMETYGLLMKQNEEGITLMTEFYREDDGRGVYRGRTFVPAPLIHRVEVLASPWSAKPRKPRLKPPTPDLRSPE